MKIIHILLLTFVLNSTISTISNAQSKLGLNRFYAELGLLRGVNELYNKKTDNYTIQNKNSIGILTPTGLQLGLVVGSKNYQIKTRMLYCSGDISSIDWLEFGLLFGWIKHNRQTAFDINVGLSYQRLQDEYNRSYLYENYEYHSIGISSELNVHLTTPYIGISPFLYTNINLKAIGLGLGIKLQVGKTGYTKKQFARI